MGRFIAIRLLQFPLILAIIYLITFMLVWVAPGDPFQKTDKSLPPEVLRARKEQLHATTWYTFLGYYPLRMLRGDLGPSMGYDAWPVSTIIRQTLPVSITVGLFGLAIATFAGVTIGVMAAVWRGGPFDWFSLTVALLGVSLPGFVVASVLFALFSLRYQLFPAGNWGSLSDVFLPGVALSMAPMAYIARLMRVAMIDVLSSDYIRTARAKGLSKTKVIWKHALRNAFLPVLSFLGPAAAATLTGSFVVEKVFNLPGLGTHFVNSIKNRDQTLILGTVMVYSVFLLALNLLVDLGYAFVDPRIDVTAKAGKGVKVCSAMSTLTTPIHDPQPGQAFHKVAGSPAPDSLIRRLSRSPRIVIGGGLAALTVLICVATLPITLRDKWSNGEKNPLYFDQQQTSLTRAHPAFFPVSRWFGNDIHGRTLLSRCLLGGTISLAIGTAAAAISVVLGVSVGLLAGYRGGWIDSLLMRTVDVMYGLPYILLIILLKIALEPGLVKITHNPAAANLIVLFLAIGLVSWLTMARVIRGQVLSLRSQPFIEACRASGLTQWRIFTRHLLPNLIGPITVYATLTVPSAILEESFLSFLGIGIQPPYPTWGSLASEGLMPALNPIHHYWYMLVTPCLLLSVTLLNLNFLGDGLRDVFDPKRDAAKA